MNVAETILVFVGIPLAFVLLLAMLIFLPGRKRPRYKSGQPWNHAPVWYEPHPEHGPAAGHGTPGHEGQTKAIGSSVYGEPTGAGSADGQHPHGATAAAAAPHPAPCRPARSAARAGPGEGRPMTIRDARTHDAPGGRR